MFPIVDHVGLLRSSTDASLWGASLSLVVCSFGGHYSQGIYLMLKGDYSLLCQDQVFLNLIGHLLVLCLLEPYRLP